MLTITSRRLACALVALLALTLTTALTPTASAAPNPFSCAAQAGRDHYTVLNARGSMPGGTAALARAFVPDNRPDYAAMVTLQTSRAVDVRAIEQALAARSSAAGRGAIFVHLELSYPAWLGTTSPANGTALRASLETYEASVAKGLSSLEQAAAAARAGCPSTKIVALGYSQGAEVLQRFMSRAGNDAYAPMVHSVILVGSPLRETSAPRIANNPGLASVAGAGLTRAALGAAVTVRAPWSGKVADYCYSADQICALPPAVGQALASAVSSGSFSSAAAASYRSISWAGHSAYPSAFRTAILSRF